MKPIEKIGSESSSQQQGEIIITDADPNTTVSPNKPIDSLLELEKKPDAKQLEHINVLSKFDALPLELCETITTFFKDEALLSSLALTNKACYSLFQEGRLSSQFLHQVAYGEQHRVEQLFRLLKDHDIQKQKLLCTIGAFADLSERRFIGTALDYAYWAKDTHMARFLIKNMNQETRAFNSKRCEEIERNGLSYTHKGSSFCSKYFDFTPYIDALINYRNSFVGNFIFTVGSLHDNLRREQRAVPAHVIHEYCRPDRTFEPTPDFDKNPLPRVSNYRNSKLSEQDCFFSIHKKNLVKEKRIEHSMQDHKTNQLKSPKEVQPMDMISSPKKQRGYFCGFSSTPSFSPYYPKVQEQLKQIVANNRAHIYLSRAGMPEAKALGSSLHTGDMDLDIKAMQRLDEVRTQELQEILKDLKQQSSETSLQKIQC